MEAEEESPEVVGAEEESPDSQDTEGPSDAVVSKNVFLINN